MGVLTVAGVLGIGQGLGDGEFVCIVLTHQAEVLGQRHEFGPGLGCLRDEGAGLGEVVFHPRGGDHLDGGGFHGGVRRGSALFKAHFDFDAAGDGDLVFEAGVEGRLKKSLAR
jgi:hypothetical protein